MLQPSLPAQVEANCERVVETTLDLLAFDTQNPPRTTTEIIEYIETVVTKAGLETERLSAASADHGLVAWFPEQPAPELMFNGHIDTVPFDREAWTRGPLGERDGSEIYGRGETDMKGAVAAMLAVVRAVAETDTTPAVPLGFVFSSDEETSGGETLRDGLDTFPSSPSACLIGEMTGTSARPSVAVADKGSIWLTLAATGEGAHGSWPMLGANAIDRLYDTADSLRSELQAVEFDLHPHRRTDTHRVGRLLRADRGRGCGQVHAPAPHRESGDNARWGGGKQCTDGGYGGHRHPPHGERPDGVSAGANPCVRGRATGRRDTVHRLERGNIRTPRAATGRGCPDRE